MSQTGSSDQNSKTISFLALLTFLVSKQPQQLNDSTDFSGGVRTS